MQTRVPLGLLVVLAAACSSSPQGGVQTATANAPLLLLEDCDPIVPDECGMPYPSSVWTTPDSTTATGVHLYFGDTTLPTWNLQGDHVDKTPWLGRDGFSPGSAIMTHLPNATVTGLADAYHIEQSVLPTSPTLLIEYSTGALVPHWAELDESETATDDRRTFFIRPAIRLQDAARYLVVIRNVVDDSGAPLPVNAVFQALRDATSSDELSVAPRRALYADIVSKLQSYGVDIPSLQLAWDFTTASKADTTQWMIHMRDDALQTVGTAGPAYTYSQCTAHPSGPSADACGVFDDPNPYIRRRIIGQMTVPLYLDEPNPGATLHFGPDGMPAQNGTAVFQFTVQIPNSLVNSGQPGPIIQNAHGLFGDQSEGRDSYMAETCDREGYVEIAVDLVGMASDDGSGYVPNLVTGDLSLFYHLVDRLHQGFINELLAMRMMIGGMASDPATSFDGKPTIDPTQRFYRGDSQGGISGGVYMAISTDVTRGLMGEPGAPYNLLLDRSVDFQPFFVLMRGAYPDPIDAQLGLGLIQSLWDRAEPDGYIPYISQAMLPGTPAHHVLIHDAIGDQQVTPLGAHFIARTIGAQNLQPVNREVYGIQDGASGFAGNGICEWSFGLPASQSPVTDVPPPSNTEPDPHDTLRQQADAQDMADVFFRTGNVVQTCAAGAPCAAPVDWADGGVLPAVTALDGGEAPEAGGRGRGELKRRVADRDPEAREVDREPHHRLHEPREVDHEPQDRLHEPREVDHEPQDRDPQPREGGLLPWHLVDERLAALVAALLRDVEVVARVRVDDGVPRAATVRPHRGPRLIVGDVGAVVHDDDQRPRLRATAGGHEVHVVGVGRRAQVGGDRRRQRQRGARAAQGERDERGERQTASHRAKSVADSGPGKRPPFHGAFGRAKRAARQLR